MLDKKIEERNFRDQGKDNEKSYMKERHERGLTLRKKKLDNYFAKKRNENLNGSKPSSYEISVDSLQVPQEIRDRKYDDVKVYCEEMSKLLRSGNRDLQKFSIKMLIKETNENQSLAQPLFEGSIVDSLFYVIYDGFPDLQIIYGALWCLINISCLTEIARAEFFLVGDDCYTLYKKILELQNDEISGSLCWFLGNVAIDSLEMRRMLIQKDLVTEYILPRIESGKIENKFLEEWISVLFPLSIAIGGEQDDEISESRNLGLLTKKLTELFCVMVYSQSEKIKDISFICLSKLSNIPSTIDTLFTSGILRKVVKGELNVSSEQRKYFIQILGNFLSGMNMSLVDPILRREICEYLIPLLSSKDGELKRTACWSLSNFCVDSEDNMKILIDYNIIPLVFNIITEEPPAIAREGLFILISGLSCDDINIGMQFMKYQPTEILIKVIQRFEKDAESILNILSCFDCIFELGDKISSYSNGSNPFKKDFLNVGGKEVLDKLQMIEFKDDRVYHETQELIRKHFKYENN